MLLPWSRRQMVGFPVGTEVAKPWIAEKGSNVFKIKNSGYMLFYKWYLVLQNVGFRIFTYIKDDFEG